MQCRVVGEEKEKKRGRKKRREKMPKGKDSVE